MKIRKRLKRPANTQVTPYDLFIIAITVLSLVNLILYLFLKDENLLFAISIIDIILSGFFLIDFLSRFVSAEKKAVYFFKELGWADLLASLPFPQFKLLRIFRLVKAYGFIKRAGFENIKQGFNKYRASAALLTVFFIIILLLEFGSVGILAIEGNHPEANIRTASDALWWVYVTITTVGYGDRFPVTDSGRVLGAFVMLVGVGLFGVITGFLANKFLPSSSDGDKDVALNKDVALAQLREDMTEVRSMLEAQQHTTKSSSEKE